MNKLWGTGSMAIENDTEIFESVGSTLMAIRRWLIRWYKARNIRGGIAHPTANLGAGMPA
jgi:hypothetical protein